MKPAMTAAAVGAFALASVLVSSPAYAGSNGQRIYFRPESGLPSRTSTVPTRCPRGYHRGSRWIRTAPHGTQHLTDFRPSTPASL
ncbi:hypothetical protein GCM10009753_29520 [Streptantibioticus ferralitis]